MKAAALQFTPANPAVAAVISRASRPERIAGDFAALSSAVLSAFWDELREVWLIATDAPVPSKQSGV